MNSRRLSNDQRYFQSYDQFQVHELMLRDRPRVTAYHDAIMNNKHLFENKVVLDVGSGTGILSMFAAKAGAKLVYAVDACPTICDLAEELIKCNRLQDRIRVMNKRVEEIENFDENIDIIISEWMGKSMIYSSRISNV
jgi:protein arginine N-methyltransferase 8